MLRVAVMAIGTLLLLCPVRTRADEAPSAGDAAVRGVLDGLARQSRWRTAARWHIPAGRLPVETWAHEESQLEEGSLVTEVTRIAARLAPDSCEGLTEERAATTSDWIWFHSFGVDSFSVAFDFQRRCVTFLRFGVPLATRAMGEHGPRLFALLRPPTESERKRMRPPKGVVLPLPDEESPELGEHVLVDVPPEAASRVPPAYPETARQKGIEGVVLVRALVGRDGSVRRTVVTEHVAGLDEAAEAAVRQWRFKPARFQGRAVATWVAVPVSFKLK